MDIKRLSHLLALADECHFARAAERVHLSQPAFSRSIQALEQELDLRLFDRDNGPVQPTPAGRHLIERARKLVFDARGLKREMQLYAEAKLGDVAFGLGPIPAALLLPQIGPALRQQHPEVALRIETTNWALLYERLRSEDIEFFVADVRDIPPDPALSIEHLVRLRGRFYVRAGHPLAARACTLDEIWRYGIASLKLPRFVEAAVRAHMTLPATTRLLAFECDALEQLTAVALHSDTVAATMDAAVQDEIKHKRLVPLTVRGLPALYAETSVVRLKERTPSPMAIKVVEALQGAVAALA
ncbi:MAG: LysR family transcriptional regulator [Paucibacter sp.]|nr:LysR family transcriptional regulator [Roseateles sp.]